MQNSFPATRRPDGSPLTLAVIGGGLAGIAAAEHAKRLGFDVELFEWSRVLGGRAASLFEPTSAQWIDNGQHIVLGCCSEFLALNKRLGLEKYFERQSDITFASADGKRWTMSASPFLPTRWQLVPAFLKIPFLSFKDRLATGLTLRKLPKVKNQGNELSFGAWLASEHASKSSIDKFWAPLIYSALSETVDNVSFAAAQKVVRDGFLAGRDAMSMFVPTAPLRSIYHDAAAAQLTELGIKLNLMSRVENLNWTASEEENAVPTVDSLTLADGTVRSFDRFVLAIPSFRVWKLLEESGLEEFADYLDLGRFEPGAITSVHCWFDRPILPNEQRQSALVGGPAQFLFCPPRSSNETSNCGVYHTAVISASHRLLEDVELTSRGRTQLIDRLLKQFRTTFPDAFQDGVELRHSRVTTVFNAVFSPNPTIYSLRPMQTTPLSNLALAGDWTQTDWPATLEGAVRSGILAVDAVAR